MSVFIKTISDLVALILQSLRLSVLLPAAALVGLNLTFILPMLKNTKLYHSLNLNNGELPLTFIVFLSILIVAYFLSVANIPIIRFFEGFPWLHLGKVFCNVHRRRVHFLQIEIGKLDENFKNDSIGIDRLNDKIQQQSIAIDEMDKRIEQKRDQQKKEDIKRQKGQLSQDIKTRDKLYNKVKTEEMQKSSYLSELCWFYPHHQLWRILPTKLGNVLASAEEYSGHLYGLDAVTFWPFLSPILSKEGYAPFVEQEKTSLDFPLNMLVITLFFGLELAYFDFLLSHDVRLTILKLLIIFSIASIFYLLSIQGALSWGYTIRTAFVLYRDKLRECLGLHKPEGFYQERIMWKRATRFYLEHDVTPGNYIFSYEKSGTEKSQNETFNVIVHDKMSQHDTNKG